MSFRSGATLMPAVLKARTNGEDAVAPPSPSLGSSAEINKPTKSRDKMYWNVCYFDTNELELRISRIGKFSRRHDAWLLED